VGLPGRILHGLWTMAQVARAAEQVGGDDPTALRRLSVQFRGMGALEQEIVVGGTVREAGDTATLELEAEQAGNKIIRNAEAEVRAAG
jgi:acyl dehydratase